MGPSGRITHVIGYIGYVEYIRLLGTCFMQVFYLGKDPRTKETLPNFMKWRRVTRYPLVFRGLKGSQRIPRDWGVTYLTCTYLQIIKKIGMSIHPQPREI